MPARNTPLTGKKKLDQSQLQRLPDEKQRSAVCAGSEPFYNKDLEVSEEERRRRYEECWDKGGLGMMVAFADSGPISKPTKRSQLRKGKIRTIVKDPAVAELLMPDHIYACKRPCLDSSYFETYNRPNVTLVDIREAGIDRITPHGLRANGKEYQLNMVCDRIRL